MKDATRCCTLHRAKNTPTRSFVSRTVNLERGDTSHHATAIYQISNIKSFLPVEAEISVTKV